MKNIKALLVILLLITAFIINSCKKENQTSIKSLFSYGRWELASVMVTKYTGNTIDTTYQLNTNCNLTQTFTFNSNGTCTYTNFDCISQTSAPASWAWARLAARAMVAAAQCAVVKRWFMDVARRFASRRLCHSRLPCD